MSWLVSKAPKSESEALYHKIVIIATNAVNFWKSPSLKRQEWRAWERQPDVQLALVGGGPTYCILLPRV